MQDIMTKVKILANVKVLSQIEVDKFTTSIR